MKSRLFHAVVVVGASLGAGALAACTAVVESTPAAITGDHDAAPATDDASPPPVDRHDAGHDSPDAQVDVDSGFDAGYVSEAGLYLDAGDGGFVVDSGVAPGDAGGDALSPDSGWHTTK